MIVLDIETVKFYVSSIDRNVLYENFVSHLRKAERFLKELIGEAVFLVADQHANDPDTSLDVATTKIYDQLLDLCRGPVCHLATISYMKPGAIMISNGGIHRTEHDGMATAYKYQIREAESEFRDIAYTMISDLLAFLDRTSTDAILPEWNTSMEKKLSMASWVRPADMANLLGVDNAHYFFHAVRAQLIEAQKKQILPRIGAEKYNEIQNQLLDNNLSDENKIILQAALFPILLAAMALVVRRRSLEILPVGVFKNWFSDSDNQKETTTQRERQDMENKFLEDFKLEADQFEMMLKKMKAPPTEAVPVETLEQKQERWRNTPYLSL